jgi:hypothetical protein
VATQGNSGVASIVDRRTESDIMSRIFQVEGLCREAFDAAPLPESPDLEAIESFVLKCYLAS